MSTLRRLMALLAAFCVLGIPVVLFVEMESAFNAYMLLGAASFFILVVRTRTYYFSVWKNKVLPEAKPYFTIALIAMILGVCGFFVCIFMLTEGSPQIRDGVYGLWNRGELIRELGLEEFRVLRRVERMAFCSWVVAANSMMILTCCKADRIIP